MTVEPIRITEPGLYPDLDENVYHRDPVPQQSLSSTGARRILEKPPAVFHHERSHPKPPTKAMEFGRIAHSQVLGTGDSLYRLENSDMRTKAAKEEAADAVAQGLTPMKADEYDTVMAMVAALWSHPRAAQLLSIPGARPEVSMFWQHEPTGTMCRGRLDELPPPTSGRLIVPDYKSAADLSDAEVERSIWKYGYHQQSEWYRAGIKALGLHDDPGFAFVMQEKTAPYLVRVVEIHPEAARIGRRLNREALRVYAECVESGQWPGYSTGTELIGLPDWVMKREK